MFSKTRNEILNNYLTSAIENEQLDLILDALEKEGFESTPSNDHQYIKNALENRASTSAQLLIEQGFSTEYPEFVNDILRNIGMDSEKYLSGHEASLDTLTFLKAHLLSLSSTYLTEHVEKRENEVSRARRRNSYNLLSILASLKCEALRKEFYQWAINSIDFKALSNTTLLRLLSKSDVFDVSESEALIDLLLKTKRLHSLSSDDLKAVFNATMGGKKGAGVAKRLLDSQLLSEADFLESITNGHNRITWETLVAFDESLANAVIRSGSTGFYVDTFISSFAADVADERRQPDDKAFNLIIEYLIDYNANNIKKGDRIYRQEHPHLEKLINELPPELLRPTLERLVSQVENKDALLIDFIYLIQEKHFHRNEIEPLVDLLSTNPDYIKLLKKMKALSETEGSDRYIPISSHVLYLGKAFRLKGGLYCKRLVEAVPMSQRTLIELVSNDYLINAESAQDLIQLISIFSSPMTKEEKVAIKDYFYRYDDNTSAAKILSSVRKSKQKDSKYKKLWQLATMEKDDLIQAINSANKSKDGKENVQILLQLTGYTPYDLMTSTKINNSGNTALIGLVG